MNNNPQVSEATVAGLPSPPPQETVTSVPVLRSAQAIRHFERLAPGTLVHADLLGVITGRRKHRDFVFFDLSDTSHSIQLIAPRTNDEVWKTALEARKADRVHAAGVVMRTTQGTLSISLTNLERLISAETLSDRNLLRTLQACGTHPGFLLARLSRLALGFLEEEGFNQFEASYISTAIVDSPIEPLDILFPGWGARTSLVPSPIPQLLAAAVVYGSPRVFAISRVFSRAIRDGFTSAEALSAAVVITGESADLASALRLGGRTIRHVLEPFLDGEVERQCLQESETWEERDGTRGWEAVTSPCHLVHKQQLDELTSTAVRVPRFAFRTMWPPDIAVVEGHVSTIEDAIPFAALTVHIERLVRLLLGTSLRRLQYRGPDDV